MATTATKYALKATIPPIVAGTTTAVVLIGSNFSASRRVGYILAVSLATLAATTLVETIIHHAGKPREKSLR